MQMPTVAKHHISPSSTHFNSPWEVSRLPPVSEILHRHHLSTFSSVSGSLSVPNMSWNGGNLLRRCQAVTNPISKSEFTFDVLKKEGAQEDKHPTVEMPEDVEGLKKWIDDTKAMLRAMGDGEISISAYDTAWVALVEDIHGNGGPQFPSSLKWIVDNQLSDGSWGDSLLFTAHDRLINTLACVIALKSWDMCPEMCNAGLYYLRENMEKMEEANEEHMPIGFEIAFPSLLDIARRLDLDIPYDIPAMQEIYAMRNLKLKRIPKDIMHNVPTTLLHSLEGMENLEWDRLLKLQSSDGSFLFSPSSTAFALQQTKDKRCLEYIEKIVSRFNGGVPNVYPVDMFEHIWAVDRLERLGISRYFEPEIKECLDHVYRYWSDEGVCWARNTSVVDVDDTAMGFRLLRLHGYDVSSDVFRNFYKDGKFFCFAGQSTQAVTGMYNLNRASQVQLPGETILEEARRFSYGFLREKQARNELLDKWIITKDLPGEVEYALDFPWYMSLGRVEARTFLEQYGGENDVWIGKTLYRMPFVNNNIYLELAKSDFNRCQLVHQNEWKNLPKWLKKCDLKSYGVSEEELLRSYFLAASTIFEPKRSVERLSWARSSILINVVASYLMDNCCSKDRKQDFIKEFQQYNRRSKLNDKQNKLVVAIMQTIDLISHEATKALGKGRASEHSRIHHHLNQAWKEWMVAIVDGRGEDGSGALLLARTIELCAGRWALEDSFSSYSSTSSSSFSICSNDNNNNNNNEQQQYLRLAHLTSSICGCLHDRLNYFQNAGNDTCNGNEDVMITDIKKRSDSLDEDMQKLVQCLLKNCGGLEINTKNTFLNIAKTFYYVAHCPPPTIKTHISKVLFEKVV